MTDLQEAFDAVAAARRCWESDKRAVAAHRESLRDAIESEDNSFAQYAKARWGLLVGGKVYHLGKPYRVLSILGYSKDAETKPHLMAAEEKPKGRVGLPERLIDWSVK